MTFVAELDPPALWKHFDEIMTIPRGSKDEGRVRDYVLSVVEKTGLPHKADAAGNVVVQKAGTAGHENAPIVILQAHLDMVEEKNSDVDHNFDTDPIIPRRDGDYLKATGTTLGADNGIGVAAMLAIMEESNLEHGPLELLFTIDEESGLTGAGQLGAKMLEGKILLNLDSEDEGILTIGCAGGADSHLFLPISREAAPGDSKALKIRIFGLKGGHSGCDIHLNRGNANKVLARVLKAAWGAQPYHLADIQGGNAHNAIPRESHAVVLTSGTSGAEAFSAAAAKEFEVVQAEYRSADPDVQMAIEDATIPADTPLESAFELGIRGLREVVKPRASVRRFHHCD